MASLREKNCFLANVMGALSLVSQIDGPDGGVAITAFWGVFTAAD